MCKTNKYSHGNVHFILALLNAYFQTNMQISKIEIRDYSKANVEACRDLCNELMKFQAEQSHTGTDVLAAMTFDNRLKPSFESALLKKLLLAFDGKDAVGYVYADVSDVAEERKLFVPEWAKEIYREGQNIFYNSEQKLPARLGTFNNLYIKPGYHGLGIGNRLSKIVMDWMKSIERISGIYVYVSNGNERVADFYRKFGFEYSHDVLGGFIKAYYHNIPLQRLSE